MSTKIHIPRKCQYCGNIFIAQTTTTRYCSHKCNSRHYKQVIKEMKMTKSIEEAKAITLAEPAFSKKETVTVSKEFYSIKETALLLGVHERTVMKMVWTGRMPHARIGRRVIIEKAKVIELFRF